MPRQDPATTAGMVSPTSDHLDARLGSRSPPPGYPSSVQAETDPGVVRSGDTSAALGAAPPLDLAGFEPLQAAATMAPTPRLLIHEGAMRPESLGTGFLPSLTRQVTSTAVKTAFQLSNSSPQLFIVTLGGRLVPLDRLPVHGPSSTPPPRRFSGRWYSSLIHPRSECRLSTPAVRTPDSLRLHSDGDASGDSHVPLYTRLKILCPAKSDGVGAGMGLPTSS